MSGPRIGWDAWSLAVSPDGQTLACSILQPNGRLSAAIGLWDLPTGRFVRNLTGHQYFCKHIVISPDGQTLVGGGQNNIMVWNLHTGVLQRTLTGHTGEVAVAISPDGQVLVSGGADRTIKVWGV